MTDGVRAPDTQDTKIDACESASPKDKDECIAWIGQTPIRALAIEMVAEFDPKRGYRPKPLERSARKLLGRPGIILVPTMDIRHATRSAKERNLIEPVSSPNLSSTTPPGVLIPMSSLIYESENGADAVVKWIREEIELQIGRPAEAAFKWAREDWKEQDDAA